MPLLAAGRSLMPSGNPLHILRKGIDQLFDQLGVDRDKGRSADPDAPQRVPVNVFETEHQFVVVAPMPGMEAADIEIEIDDRHLKVTAPKRGPGQERHNYVRREWSYGPYERSIDLPVDVDVEHANASFGNGILTVSLPRSPARRRRKIEITLESTGTARGERVGRRGVPHDAPDGEAEPFQSS
jgi:HSP20 family protein